MENIWRLNLEELRMMYNDSMHPVQWEALDITGRGPGKISHHTCTAFNNLMVLYGG